MSSPYESWLDRWWPLLLILFGLTFTLCLTLFRPQGEWSVVRPAVTIQTASLERVGGVSLS